MTMFDALPHTSLMAAFLAGLLSFLSPCVLPVIPSYLTSVAGLSGRRSIGAEASDRLTTTVMINSLLFIAGFAMLFIGFGMSATGIGQMLMDHQIWIRKSGAMLIVLLGLYVMMGFVKPTGKMERTRSPSKTGWIRYAGSLVIGATFAAGWTPCVGPVLGTMLQYAGTPCTAMDGITLLTFYSCGLGLPLLGLSFVLNGWFSRPERSHPYRDFAGALSGGCLVILGGVLYTDRLGYVTALLDYAGIGYSAGLNGRV